jgi:hypothetical protein
LKLTPANQSQVLKFFQKLSRKGRQHQQAQPSGLNKEGGKLAGTGNMLKIWSSNIGNRQQRM